MLVAYDPSIVTSRILENDEITVKGVSQGITTYKSTLDGRERLLKWVTLEFPKLNILVNNACIQKDIDLRKGLEDLLVDGNEISINFEAPVMLTAMFMKQLELNENPVIINVTSGLAFRPMPAVESELNVKGRKKRGL